MVCRSGGRSNGKIERIHKTLKRDAIRVKNAATLEEVRRVVAAFVDQYNNHRLHSAIDYITPADRLAGRHEAIAAARNEKLEAARERRVAWRQGASAQGPQTPSAPAPLACSP